jgi:dsRNA-specific ribonuclease
MVKVGAHQLDHPMQSQFKAGEKVAADSFETLVAALYLEQGFSALCRWVHCQYLPLISVARDVFWQL